MTDGELARLLLNARGGAPIPTGPAPEDAAQAYRVQARVMAQLGEIGGWKVGAPGPDGPISGAPMPASGVFHGFKSFDSARFTQREVESEICFLVAADLPPRATSYTREEVFGALGACHPGIEVLQSRYAMPDEVGGLALLADFIQHGAYVVGDPIDAWRELDFSALAVTQTIEGGPVRQAVGNPAGDMLRLIVWLANEGAVWAGGLRAGQVVTCGSWTGKTRVERQSAGVTTEFAGVPAVRIAFTGG